MIILYFAAELILLYLLSRRVIQTIYSLLQTLSRSRTIAIWIVSIVFFPGTVVHELAHLFTAEILGVRTGKLTLVPESLEGTEIKAGAVMIAETDPLRRTLIGVAPVLWGITLLTALSYLLQYATNTAILTPIMFYSMFAISNSMFSSKEDMKGVVPFLATLGLFAAAAYVAGFRLGLSGAVFAGLHPIGLTLVRSLGVVLGVNLVVLLLTSALLGIFRKR